LLITKIYYVLLLILVFIVQVTNLVQFPQHNTFSKIPPSTAMQFATRVRTWRVARLYREIVVARKPFGIWHIYRYIFFFLEWPILWLPRILTFPSGTSCITWTVDKLWSYISINIAEQKSGGVTAINIVAT
jgi:hypothetical protein